MPVHAPKEAFFVACNAGLWYSKHNEGAGLFITHGGMNSVSEAMIHGVPMVLIPFVSGQPVNAEQAARMGLGKVPDYIPPYL